MGERGDYVQRFIAGPVLWPTGWTKLHVYVLPDLQRDPDLARLVAQSRQVIDTYPALAPVADPWLHATVQMIDGTSTAAIPPDRLTSFTAVLRRQLADVEAFTVTAGAAMANRAGTMLDVDGDQPGEPWSDLADRVCTAIRVIFGQRALAWEPGPPHVTTAYATGDEDSGLVQGRLRRQVRPSRALMHVDAVHLVDVIQDAERSEYRWTVLDRIPLR